MRVVVKDQGNMCFKAETEKSEFTINCPQISPVEYFLGGIITCSATDIILMPKKQGFEVTDLEVTGDAVRSDDMPRKFDKLHLSYVFNSTAQDEVALRWVMASLETYCSTIATIRSDVNIEFSLIYNGRVAADHKELVSGTSTVQNLDELDGCCPS
ncbi:MAG: OsmC family peroxiredoxin [Helicobacteraceae bacterium]|nr:OsmC family peroxiredoxin [Helicobacteraceae bacterium]